MPRPRHLAAVWSVSVAAALAAGGCTTSDDRQHAASDGGAGALSAEAQTALTDRSANQAFLVLDNQPAGYSIKYPEDWTRTGWGSDITFKDENNLVHVLVSSGGLPSFLEASRDLVKLKRLDRSLVITRPPQQVTIQGSLMMRSGYSTRSPRNPVTGKRVTLLVDRYQLTSGGRLATVDLGAPRGIGDLDVHRSILESFRWS
jgi:hypothetical protein